MRRPSCCQSSGSLPRRCVLSAGFNLDCLLASLISRTVLRAPQALSGSCLLVLQFCRPDICRGRAPPASLPRARCHFQGLEAASAAYGQAARVPVGNDDESSCTHLKTRDEQGKWANEGEPAQMAPKDLLDGRRVFFPPLLSLRSRHLSPQASPLASSRVSLPTPATPSVTSRLRAHTSSRRVGGSPVRAHACPRLRQRQTLQT